MNKVFLQRTLVGTLILLCIPSFPFGESHYDNSQISIYSDYNNNSLVLSNNQISFIEHSQYDDDGGMAVGVAVKDGLAFVANQEQGLEIINYSNPQKPEKIAAYKTHGTAVNVLVNGDFVYISHSQSAFGVAIINVADPRNPIAITSITSLGSIKEVAIRANLLHIITDFGGLYIYDVSNPYHPKSIGKWNKYLLYTAISVLDKYVCLAAWGFGLEILDSTFPESPVLLGSWNASTNLSTGVYATRINNQRIAFLANTDLGLEIINFTNAQSPVKIANYNLWGPIYNVFVKDNIAYCSSDSLGLVLLDVSDPTNPIELGKYDTDGNTVDIEVDNEIIIVADKKGGVKFFNIADPMNILFISRILDHGSANAAKIVNNKVYVADKLGGFEIFNITGTKKLEKIGQYRDEEINVLDVIIKDDIAILSVDNKGLYFINISNPTEPAKINSYYNYNHVRTTALKGDLLFVGAYQSTLEVLNISNVLAITHIGTYQFSNLYPIVEAMQVQDNLLIIGSTTNCLTLLNISDISNIEVIATYTNNKAVYGLLLDNTTLFVANGQQGLQIFNITDNQFTLISGITTQGIARKLALKDNIVYVADQLKGIKAINISDVENPFEAGGYAKKVSYDVIIYGYYLVSCSYNDGLVLLALDSDSDSISDDDEVNLWGTNPYNSDTDFDGMPDDFEVKYQLNPLDPSDITEDPDNDDLTNLEEYLQIHFYSSSTNPRNPDTDGDGMPDGWEVKYNLNPVQANGQVDTDLDYLVNLQEYYYGTNPQDKDTDKDGALDGLEVLFGTDPLNPKDNPKKRQIIRVFIAIGVSIPLSAFGFISVIRYFKKRIQRNIEREGRLLASEEPILFF